LERNNNYELHLEDMIYDATHSFYLGIGNKAHILYPTPEPRTKKMKY
jgi:hypothetical protein